MQQSLQNDVELYAGTSTTFEMTVPPRTAPNLPRVPRRVKAFTPGSSTASGASRTARATRHRVEQALGRFSLDDCVSDLIGVRLSANILRSDFVRKLNVLMLLNDVRCFMCGSIEASN